MRVNAACRVSDVMSSPAVGIPADLPFKAIVDTLGRQAATALPVVDDGVVVGLVSATDLLARLPDATPTRLLMTRVWRRRGSHGALARDLMTAPAVTVTATTPIAEAARRALRDRVHELPVVDAKGHLIGTVSRAELLAGFLRPDDDIAHDVRTQVVRTAVLAGECEATAEVHDGVVTLSGDAVTTTVARRLVAGARQVPGVIDVRDDLAVEIPDESLCLGP